MYFGRIFDEMNSATGLPDDTQRIDDRSPSITLLVDGFLFFGTFCWEEAGVDDAIVFAVVFESLLKQLMKFGCSVRVVTLYLWNNIK